MDKIRILVVDDHPIVREGLRLLLEAEPDLEIIGEAADGEEALRLVQEREPDLVLMDITMPGMSGLLATQQIVRLRAQTRVLALTMHEGEEYFFRILEAGASGYLPKGAESSELLAAVRAVHRGGVYLYPPLAAILMQEFHKSREREGSGGLSPREGEVLRLIAEGKTSQEIADLLVVSVHTVQTHRAHIMEKLNLHNRAALIKYAVKRGLVSLEP